MGRVSIGRGVLTFIVAVGVLFPVSHEPREFAKVMSVEAYWAETGLQASDLTGLIQDHSCSSSLRYFLACVNAVSSVLNRMDKTLTRTGESLYVKPLQASKEMTERQMLEPWRKFFLSSPLLAQKLSFQTVLDEALAEEVTEPYSRIAAGLNGFLSVFKDPHTYIVPVEYYFKVIAKSSPKTRSLGIIMSRAATNFFIRKIYPNSPAEDSGLKKGDIVLEINDEDIRKMTFVKVNDIIRSDEATIKFKILRNNSPMEVNVVRREVEIPSVTSEVRHGERTLGVLSINKFSKNTCKLTEKTIKELMAWSIEGIILDLRDNSGGQIEEAACIAGLFMGPDKKLFELQFFDQSREREVYHSKKEMLYGGPMAILVNRGSASASELLAGALRDHGRALLVGEQTFGKGSFQEGEIWEHNEKIALFSTKGFYILPSGFSPQMYGLAPDIEVKFMNDTQPRESEQYIYALFPPSGPYMAMKMKTAQSNCRASTQSKSEDQQLSKAEQFLFCVQPIAGASDDFNASL